MRLHVIPEVVVWELENTGKECEKSTVDRFCEVVAKRLDFVHEWQKASGNALAQVVPVGLVPVELLDAIGGALCALDSKAKLEEGFTGVAKDYAVP